MKKVYKKDIIGEDKKPAIILYVRSESGTGICKLIRQWFDEKKVEINALAGGKEVHLKVKPYKFRIAFEYSDYLMGFLENSHNFINVSGNDKKIISYRERLDNSEELIYQMFE